MKDQINTIREALKEAIFWEGQGQHPSRIALDKALTALTQLEAMVGEQEPVGWWNGKETVWLEHELNGYPPPADATIPVYTAAPVAQQPQAEPHKPLFADLIAQHPGLREELLEMDKQPQSEAVPPDVVRDAERWRMLPAYFYEYQIDAMKLYRDIDAAIAQQKGGV